MSHSKSKTIAFYCSSISRGGLEMNTVRYAKWMCDRGWKIFVFCVKDSYIHQQSLEYGLEVELVNRNGKYFDFVNAFRVKKIFDKHQISLCWFRDTRDFDLLCWVKRFNGNKVKLLYQQAMQFGVSKKDLFHTMRFRPVDAWVSTLNFLAEQVKKQTNFDHKKIHVIPLGVDASVLHRDNLSKAKARNELSLPEDVFITGIIGRIDPLKGQHIALDAFLSIASKYPLLHLLIFGESTLHEGNEYEKTIQEEVKSSLYSDRIHFRPYDKRVQLFYKSIDIFMLCSKGETFGTVTIEAMSFALPVIATDSSGSPEILDHGRCGLLVEPENPSALAAALENYLNDSQLRIGLAEAGLQMYNQKFSSERSVDAMEKLVNQMLAE